MTNLDTAGLRRSSRILAHDERPKRMTLFTMLYLVTNVVATRTSVIRNASSYTTRAITYTEEVNRSFDGTPNFTRSFAFATSLADNEYYTLKETLKQEDADDFIQAMLKEVDAHEKSNYWTLINISDIGRNKIILSIWSFKRKRYPNGGINEQKSRVCAHGGIQQWEINYWETYNPVVTWISVRVLLEIAIKYEIPTRLNHFVLDFP